VGGTWQLKARERCFSTNLYSVELDRFSIGVNRRSSADNKEDAIKVVKKSLCCAEEPDKDVDESLNPLAAFCIKRQIIEKNKDTDAAGLSNHGLGIDGVGNVDLGPAVVAESRTVHESELGTVEDARFNLWNE
jgi:hypothetical protein